MIQQAFIIKGMKHSWRTFINNQQLNINKKYLNSTAVAINVVKYTSV